MNNECLDKIKTFQQHEKASLPVDYLTLCPEVIEEKQSDRYKKLTENIRDIIWTMSMDLKFTYISPAVEQMLGYTPEEAVKIPVEKIVTVGSAKTVQRLYQEVLLSGRKEVEPGWFQTIDLEVVSKNGATKWCEVTISFMPDPETGNREILGVAHDISARKKNEQALKDAAGRDMLTGLYNRKAFYDRVEEKLSYARRYNAEVAVLFVDLDNFKKANDTHGHETGDMLLKEVAKRLQDSSRGADLIFRFGGDEFVIVITDPDKTYPEKLAERILKKISTPYRINNNVIDYLSASIGISKCPNGRNDAEKLIAKADTAMYHAKKGGNTFSFYDEVTRD